MIVVGPVEVIGRCWWVAMRAAREMVDIAEVSLSQHSEWRGYRRFRLVLVPP